MTTGKSIALTRRTFVGKVMSLLLNMLSRLVITFLPRSKCLLISALNTSNKLNKVINQQSFLELSEKWSHWLNCWCQNWRDRWIKRTLIYGSRNSHADPMLEFSSVQSLSHVWLFLTPWIAARQASLCITNSRSSLRLTSIESVMPSSHLILCRPLLLLPPIPPSIRVFSNESTLRMRWPKDWSFSFSISPSKEHLGLISFRMDWLDTVR